jgi:hypothetical protein
MTHGDQFVVMVIRVRVLAFANVVLKPVFKPWQAAGGFDDTLTGEKVFQYLIFSQRLARVRNGTSLQPRHTFWLRLD